jgi:predicted DNA-binding protein
MKKQTSHVGLKLPLSVKEKLIQLANERMESISTIVRIAIEAYLDKINKKK